MKEELEKIARELTIKAFQLFIVMIWACALIWITAFIGVWLSPYVGKQYEKFTMILSGIIWITYFIKLMSHTEKKQDNNGAV